MEIEQEILRRLDGLAKWQIDHEIADSARSDQIPQFVRDAVETQINGNLRDIKKHLGQQDEKLEIMGSKIDALKVETAPIIESKNTIVSLRRFLVWIATPFAIMWAIWEFLLSKVK